MGDFSYLKFIARHKNEMIDMMPPVMGFNSVYLREIEEKQDTKRLQSYVKNDLEAQEKEEYDGKTIAEIVDDDETENQENQNDVDDEDDEDDDGEQRHDSISVGELFATCLAVFNTVALSFYNPPWAVVETMVDWAMIWYDMD